MLRETREEKRERERLTRVAAPSRSEEPEMAFTELRKGSGSRKAGYGTTRSHRRSAYSIIGGFTTPERDGDETSTATASSSSGSGYKIELDYRPKRAKPSKGKGHKGRAR